MSAEKGVALVNDLIRAIEQDPVMSAEMKILSARSNEFSSPMAAKLAGIVANPIARRRFDDELDARWLEEAPRFDAEEVVIGGGLHASIYCAVRVAQGHEPPLVLERSDRPGGTFAVSREPTFHLNSRNRPGNLSLPQREGALNVIPGGPIQPADLSGAEYQRNSDLAFAIRVTLALNANVAPAVEVNKIVYANSTTRNRNDRRYKVKTSEGDVYADRVLISPGLGEEKRTVLRGGGGNRVLTFLEFMQMMDRPFPLRGMERVAVIGVGDSARVAVEALCGQGPVHGMSMASLDFPSRIDWYGLSNVFANEGLNQTCASFEQLNRSRYKPIGRLLPRENGQEARVMPRTRAGVVSEGYKSCYVDETPYDYAVMCIGFDPARIDVPDGWQDAELMIGARSVARQYLNEQVFTIGAGAYLPISDAESRTVGAFSIGENSAALFRYAGRTATLASNLNGTKVKVEAVPSAAFQAAFS